MSSRTISKIPALFVCLISFLAIIFINAPAISAGQKMNARVAKSYGKLPLPFVENKGQMDKRARFVIRGPRASAFFRNDGVTFDLWEASKKDRLNKKDMLGKVELEKLTKPEKRRHAVLKLTFKGADPNCRVEGMDSLPGKVNYMKGKDKSKWQTDVSTYKGVIYKNVWQGIDVMYRGDRRQLKYDIRVNPGADIRKVQLRYDGAQRMWLDKKGTLHIKTAVTEFIEKVPGIYQEKSSRKINVQGGYKLLDRKTVGFYVKNVDPSLPLVIDPASDLVYSTFLGGTDDSEYNASIAVASSGCTYLTGQTRSTDFPTTPGAFRTFDYEDYEDSFISKLDATGGILEYSTYFGGTAQDITDDIAVDSEGCAYVTGYATSPDFPTTSGAFDTSFNGGGLDSFITKLNPSGSGLVYSSFIGGSSWDSGSGITIDQYDCAYLTGMTYSSDFPRTDGAYNNISSFDNIYVIKMNYLGNGLEYSSQIGGSGNEYQGGITLDSSCNAYIVGNTTSVDFPTTPGAYDLSYNSSNDLVIFKLNASGSELESSTFLGGAKKEYSFEIKLDHFGYVYISGNTESEDFSTTPNAFDRSYNGGAHDMFICKLDSTLNNLIFSTYLGGAEDDFGYCMSVDPSDCVCVAGFTKSLNFPTTAGALSRSLNSGGYDICLTRFNLSASDLAYSTYLGGTKPDTATDMTTDEVGCVYVTGQTVSADFPTTPGAYDRDYTNGGGIYVAKIWINPAPTNIGLTPNTGTIMIDTKTTLTSDYWEPNGYENVKNCSLMMNAGSTTTGAGYFLYDAANNLLYLRNTVDDAMIGGFAPGSNQVIDNGSIMLYCADTTVQNTGNNMVINWSIALKPYFSGNTCTAYMQVINNDDFSDGMEQMGLFNTLTCKSDLLIKSGTESTYTGTNVFSTDGSNQAKSQTATPGQKITYSFKVKNAGIQNDSFTITAPAGGSGWSVRYYDLLTGAELTSQVTGSGWSSGILAPGGVSKGIFVKITPNATVPAGTVNTLLITAASEADDSKIDVVKAVTTFAGTYKTDMILKAGSETSYTGTNVFNADGTGQMKALNVSAGQKVTYTFRAQNAGNASDSFRITGTSGGSGWSVKYYDIATNAEVTSQVTGAGWVSPILAPKGTAGVYANVRFDSSVSVGSTITLSITGSSESDNTKTDVVKAVTTCVASYKPDMLIKNGVDESYIGTGIINLDGTDQTKSQNAAAGVKVTYSFRVMNVGNLSDSIKITGTSGGSGWSVKYYDLASVDITSQVTGSGWSSGTLAPGSDRGFFVKVSPDASVGSGASKTLLITATSVGDGTKTDVVKAVTSVP